MSDAQQAASAEVAANNNNEPSQVQEKKLEGEELKEAVRKQIEYYFSPQNLANDAFLVSHMNKDLYVALDLISTFKIMKAMTTDPEVIKRAILDSKVLTLDETGTKVKPNSVATQQRTTIIIRDIEATAEELTALFPDNLKPKQVKADIAFTFYVMYDNEDQTIRAFDFLRSITFKDEAIRARIKSEAIIKPAVPATMSAPPAVYAAAHNRGAAPRNGVPHQQPPFGFWDPHAQPYYPSMDPFRGGYQGRGGRNFNNRGGSSRKRGGKDGAYNGRKRDSSPPQDEAAANPAEQAPVEGANFDPAANTAANRPRSKDGNFRGGSARGGKSRRNSDFEKRQQQNQYFNPNQPLPNFTKQSFPPLPSLSKYEAQSSGYAGEFILYAKQTVIDVFNKQVDNLVKPADLPANCTAVLSAPITTMELTKLLPMIAANEQQQQAIAAPVASSAESAADAQPKQQSAEVQNAAVAPIQIPNKSFAEVAITAKDIKSPDLKKPRHNSFKKSKEDDASAKHQQQAQQQAQQPAQQQEQQQKPQQEQKQQHNRRDQNNGNKKQHQRNNNNNNNNNSQHHNEKRQNNQDRKKKQQEQQAKQQLLIQQQNAAVLPEPSSTSYAAMVTKKSPTTPKEDTSSHQAPTQPKEQQAAPVAEKKD